MRYIMKMTREIHYSLVSCDGSFYEKPIGIVARKQLDGKRIKFLQHYIGLLMDTRILSNTTKIYIKSTLPSVASVIQSYNQTVLENERINIKTAQSTINYDTCKLLKYFPDNMIQKVLLDDSCDVRVFEKGLNTALSNYTKKNKMLDNLLINVPRTEIKEDIQQEKFDDFMNTIAPYFRKNIKQIVDNLSEEALGYFWYLISTPSVNGVNKKNYDLIKSMLEP